jgi:hypothetical protein
MTRLRLYTIDRDARQVVAIDRSPVFPFPAKTSTAVSVLAHNERDALTKADNVPARF